jgi:hypothetical protein
MRTVLERATSAYQLEDKHLSVRNSISGIADLVSKTDSSHLDMASCVSDKSSGNLLRREMGDYIFSFMGRKQTSTATAAVSTIIHTCQSREDINPIMRQAIMIAGDLNATSIKEAIAKASSTGSLSNHTSSMESVSNITGDKWVSILRLGMEAACYDANKQKSFE